MTVCVLGADPGPTTGLCLLTLDPAPGLERTGRVRLIITGRLVLACNSDAACGLAEYLTEANQGPATVIGAGERFVPGKGAGAAGWQATVTRSVIGDLSSLPIAWAWRAAAEVKPWASEDRMKKAGLHELTRKMADGYDAARHALFAAVHDAGLADPLSRRQADGPP